MRRLLVVIAGLAPAGAAHAACPASRAAWTAGDPAGAEVAARACLAVTPDDLEARVDLAQAVAVKGRADEASALLAPALAAHPADPGLRLADARLAWWRGDARGAWERLADLPETLLDDPETTRLLAGVALAAERPEAARAAFDRLLDRDPADAEALWGRARARRDLGDAAGARADLDAACEAGLGIACLAAADDRAAAMEGRASLHAAWRAVPGGPDGVDLVAVADHRIGDAWRAGLEADVSARGDGAAWDALLLARAAWTGARWSVEAAAGGTPAADFFPSWTAWAEPVARLGAASSAGVRFAWVGTADRPFPLLSPVAESARGPWLLTARSWHAPDPGGTWRHFGLLRVGRDLPAGWFVRAGAGGGNGADWLDWAPAEPARAWVALAETAWARTPLLRLRGGLWWRHEASGGRTWSECALLAGVDRPF